LEANDRDLYRNAQENSEKMTWDYHNLENRGIIEFNKGHVVFIEKTLTFSHKINQVGAESYLQQIYVNDYLYGIYIDSTGKINNIFIIPKKQSKGGDPNFKSSYWVEKDKLYFFFSTDYYLQQKMEKSICYIYDKDFSRTSVEIPSSWEYENGFTTGNIWVGEKTLIGSGIDIPSTQKSYIFLVKINIETK
jgi:hypothetical protein